MKSKENRKKNQSSMNVMTLINLRKKEKWYLEIRAFFSTYSNKLPLIFLIPILNFVAGYPSCIYILIYTLHTAKCTLVTATTYRLP